MSWTFDDGGRKAASFKGDANDCVCRAIAIAAERSYEEVYDELNLAAGQLREARLKRGRGRLPGKYVARLGVPKDVIHEYLSTRGWSWTPTMTIGAGCKVHLRADELPRGRLIVSVSKHLVAVVDGVVRDTHDCTRGGLRCVYGYYQKVLS